MAKKMLFIYNPFSGKGLIKNYLADITDTFTKSGYDVTVYPTQAKGDLKKKIISDFSGYDRIVISGGDGTVNEAASALYRLDEKDRPPIGYIPAGTTNDFAANLAIPSDIIGAAETAVSGVPRKCDIGIFNGEAFVYVAATGAFTAVSYETPQKIKNILGHSAYILEGIRSLPKITAVPMSIRADNEERRGNYVICMILNSAHVAGVSLKEYYSVDIHDGVFEAALIEIPENIRALEQALTAVYNGKSKGPGFEVLRGSEFEIKSRMPIKWTVDGEFGAETARVNIKVLPGAVTFIGRGEN